MIILIFVWAIFIVYEPSDSYDHIGYALGLWFVGICLTINGLVSTAWIYHLTKNNYFEYSQEFVSFEMEKLQRTYENKSMFKRISSKIMPGVSSSRKETGTTTFEIESRSDPSPYESPSSPTGTMGSSDDAKITKTNTFDLDPLDEEMEIQQTNTFDLDDSKERSVTGFSSKTEMAEKIYTSFPLRDILVTDIGFRLFMQHMFSTSLSSHLISLILSTFRIK